LSLACEKKMTCFLLGCVIHLKFPYQFCLAGDLKKASSKCSNIDEQAQKAEKIAIKRPILAKFCSKSHYHFSTIFD
jgi:hypothetical protein